jgi:alanyl aminopeptidase
VPLLDVKLDCAGGAPRLALAQTRLLPLGSKGAGEETWQIPVCSRANGGGGGGGGGASDRACTLLTAKTGGSPAPTAACPAWLLGNDGEAGYYRARYGGDLLSKLLAVADTELTLPERVGVIRDEGALAAAGAVPMSDALALVPRFAGAKERQTVLATVQIAEHVREHLVPADSKANYARFVSKMYGARARELGFAARSGESEDTQLLRVALVPFVAEEGNEPELVAEARRLTLRWLDDHAAVSAEMSGRVLQVAASHGDRDLFDRLHAAAKKEKDRRDIERILRALGSFRDPALVRDALALFLSTEFNAREAYGILFAATRVEDNQALVWDFMKANYDAIVARLPREITGFLPYLGGNFCDAERRTEVAAFFQERAGKLMGGTRSLAQALEAIDLCVASRSAQEPGVREFLKGY